MNHVRHIALYLAGCIILLHAIIPHQHEQSLSASEHEKVHSEKNSIVDELAYVLHESHDEGELDNYNSSAYSALEIDVNLLPVLLSFAIEKTIERDELIKLVDYQIFEWDQRNFLPQIANRPPPAII